MDEIVGFLLEDFIEKDKKDVFITAQFIKNKDGESFNNINEIKEYMQFHGLIKIGNIRWHPTEKARGISREGGWLKHLDKQKEFLISQQVKLDNKEQLEIRIAMLTEINLTLQNKQLKTKMWFSIIGFIIGVIVTNWKEILTVLKIISPPETK